MLCSPADRHFSIRFGLLSPSSTGGYRQDEALLLRGPHQILDVMLKKS
jgi:hypothetical protein